MQVSFDNIKRYLSGPCLEQVLPAKLALTTVAMSCIKSDQKSVNSPGMLAMRAISVVVAASVGTSFAVGVAAFHVLHLTYYNRQSIVKGYIAFLQFFRCLPSEPGTPSTQRRELL